MIMPPPPRLIFLCQSDTDELSGQLTAEQKRVAELKAQAEAVRGGRGTGWGRERVIGQAEKKCMAELEVDTGLGEEA